MCICHSYIFFNLWVSEGRFLRKWFYTESGGESHPRTGNNLFKAKRKKSARALGKYWEILKTRNSLSCSSRFANQGVGRWCFLCNPKRRSGQKFLVCCYLTPIYICHFTVISPMSLVSPFPVLISSITIFADDASRTGPPSEVAGVAQSPRSSARLHSLCWLIHFWFCYVSDWQMLYHWAMALVHSILSVELFTHVGIADHTLCWGTQVKIMGLIRTCYKAHIHAQQRPYFLAYSAHTALKWLNSPRVMPCLVGAQT